MKFEVTQSFEADYRRLSPGEASLLRAALGTFVAACDRRAADPTAKWPA